MAVTMAEITKLRHLTSAGLMDCKKALAENRYLEDISGCPIPMSDIETYPDECDLIEREMVYLTDNLTD